MTPEELGRELRGGTGPFLRRRRVIVGLSLFSVSCMSLISLYQVGILKKVPEPTGFDSEKVNGSPMAYGILKTPDALLAIGSYTATAALAAMGPEYRAQTLPAIPLAMASKTLLDALLAGTLLVVQPVKFRAFSFWSVLSAVAAIASCCLAWPEANTAIKELRKP